MAEVEVGLGKSGRRAYGFDDIAIVPSRRTRDPEDVDIKWEIDLNGTVIKSQQVKTGTTQIQRNYKSEWEMGIDNSEIKPETFFKGEKLELVSIDKNYVGMICKTKNQKEFRTLLKDKSGNLIFKPNGKSGDFIIKKGDCVFDENKKLERVILYDSNGDVTYRWEVDLNGVVLKSDLIKS